MWSLWSLWSSCEDICPESGFDPRQGHGIFSIYTWLISEALVWDASLLARVTNPVIIDKWVTLSPQWCGVLSVPGRCSYPLDAYIYITGLYATVIFVFFPQKLHLQNRNKSLNYFPKSKLGKLMAVIQKSMNYNSNYMSH